MAKKSAKKSAKKKIWTVHMHRRGDPTDTRIENIEAPSREKLFKSARSGGWVINKATKK